LRNCLQDRSLLLKEEKRLIDLQKIIIMIDKKAIIRMIESLPDADLMKISEFLSSLEERPDARNYRADALSRVVGICDGPQDLAEKHDSYQAPLTACTANFPGLTGAEGAPPNPRV